MLPISRIQLAGQLIFQTRSCCRFVTTLQHMSRTAHGQENGAPGKLPDIKGNLQCPAHELPLNHNNDAAADSKASTGDESQ